MNLYDLVQVHMMQYERNMRAEGREKQNSRFMYGFFHNAPVFNACCSSWPVWLFLVEKCFGSGTRRAHRVNQVSRKLWICTAALLATCWVAKEKNKFVLVLAPHLSYGIAYECTCMLLEGSDQEGAPRAVLHPLPSSRTTWCLLWRSTRS